MNLLQKLKTERILLRMEHILKKPKWETSLHSSNDGEEMIRIHICSDQNISSRECTAIVALIEEHLYECDRSVKFILVDKIVRTIFKGKKSVNLLVSNEEDEYTVLVCSITL